MCAVFVKIALVLHFCVFVHCCCPGAVSVQKFGSLCIHKFLARILRGMLQFLHYVCGKINIPLRILARPLGTSMRMNSLYGALMPTVILAFYETKLAGLTDGIEMDTGS